MRIATIASGLCLIVALPCNLNARPETIEVEYRCYNLTTNEMQRLTHRLEPVRQKRENLLRAARTNSQAAAEELRREAWHLDSVIHSNKLQYFETITPVSTNRLAVRPGERFDHTMTLGGKELRFGGITGRPRDNTGQTIYRSASRSNDDVYTFGDWWLYYDNTQKSGMTGAAFVDKHPMFFELSTYKRLFLIVVPRLHRQGMRTTESTPTK